MSLRHAGKPESETIRALHAPAPGGGISPDRLSELIGDIYDCVLNPANWQSVLEAICHEFTFASSALGVVPLHAGAQVVNVSYGFDPEWMSLVGNERYKNASVAIWGGAAHAQQVPLDEPIIGSQSPGYPARHTNPYFREVLEPRGFLDAALITIAREPSLIGYVAFNRHRSAGDISETEIEGLRLLGPHFRRAVTISNLFDLKAIEASSFSSALDGISFGVVLVDEHLHIVHTNAAARRMLDARDPIRSEAGVVTLPLEIAQAALERAVRQSASDGSLLGPRGIGIPARRTKGDPCVVHVLPLRTTAMRRGVAQRATAALFVAPGIAKPHMPSDAIALLYDLTPAEARVFEMICAGMTRSAIGKALGIAQSTVKTHLFHLFAKTGCERQADLLRLAGDMSLPV